MEITYYGANCFKVVSKNTSVVIDDNLKKLGLDTLTTDKDAALFTQRMLKSDDLVDAKIVIDGPGEYELDDITVLGIQARAYTDNEGEMTATIYKVMSGEHQVLFLGHIQPKVDSKTLEKIGVVDVLVVPVGGSGYTLDAEDASEITKLLSPKVIIPSHFDDPKIKYDMPMRGVDEFLTKMGVTDTAKLKSLKLKGELEETIITLERN